METVRTETVRTETVTISTRNSRHHAGCHCPSRPLSPPTLTLTLTLTLTHQVIQQIRLYQLQQLGRAWSGQRGSSSAFPPTSGLSISTPLRSPGNPLLTPSPWASSPSLANALRSSHSNSSSQQLPGGGAGASTLTLGPREAAGVRDNEDGPSGGLGLGAGVGIGKGVQHNNSNNEGGSSGVGSGVSSGTLAALQEENRRLRRQNDELAARNVELESQVHLSGGGKGLPVLKLLKSSPSSSSFSSCSSSSSSGMLSATATPRRFPTPIGPSGAGALSNPSPSPPSSPSKLRPGNSGSSGPHVDVQHLTNVMNGTVEAFRGVIWDTFGFDVSLGGFESGGREGREQRVELLHALESLTHIFERCGD